MSSSSTSRWMGYHRNRHYCEEPSDEGFIAPNSATGLLRRFARNGGRARTLTQQDRDLDRRPDPDALLALAGQETRGRLWVFLGAAPGVGKTYAMLQRARGLKQAGVDVVVGLVETHGRSETAALVEGLEILPRRNIDYRGHTIEEFDLDA